MSELKEHIFSDIDEVFPRGYCGPLPSQEARPYYLKSEADNVIAEKDKEIEELQKQVHDYAQGLYVMQARAEMETRHHKYKRCLAMARWCMARYNEWAAYFPTTTTRKMKFLDKWEKAWRKLAEQFKPNNSTAQ